MAAKPSRDTLIHCEACGEDYSSTYRSCPFCGARSNPRRASGRDDPKSNSRYIPTPPPIERRDSRETLDDTYIFDGQDVFDEEAEEEYYAPRPKGGKRLAPKEGGNFELPPINWPRLITFLCSLVIIVAALVIVFTIIYPQLHGSTDPKADSSAEVSTIPSQDPGTIYSAEPAPIDPDINTDPVDPVTPVDPVDPPDDSTTPGATTTIPTGTPATIVNASGGLRVRSGPGTTYEIVDSLFDGNPINVIAPADNGWYQISFTASGGTARTGYIMGDYISTIAGVPATPAPADTNPSSTASGGPTVGQTGTIINAATGLRVRSGPGTTYEVLESLVNGNAVIVLADAGNGWYQISYSGQSGAAQTGYIMGDYISTN